MDISSDLPSTLLVNCCSNNRKIEAVCKIIVNKIIVSVMKSSFDDIKKNHPEACSFSIH